MPKKGKRPGVYRLVTIKCLVCGTDFQVKQYRAETAKYCSRSCLAKVHLSQFAEHRFKATGKPPRKYKAITVNGKQMRLHRWVMQQHLGRPLHSWEHVHHIDGDPNNNDISNLQMVSNSEHGVLTYHETKLYLSRPS